MTILVIWSIYCKKIDHINTFIKKVTENEFWSRLNLSRFIQFCNIKILFGVRPLRTFQELRAFFVFGLLDYLFPSQKLEQDRVLPS
jgi:hypothetical protein